MRPNRKLQNLLRSIGTKPLFPAEESNDDDSGTSFVEDLRAEFFRSAELTGFLSWLFREKIARREIPEAEQKQRYQEAIESFFKRKRREFGIPEQSEEA